MIMANDEQHRVMRARGQCVCGESDPTFEALAVLPLLRATCCDALYLDRGDFVSLVHGWGSWLAEVTTNACEGEKA